MPNVTAVYEITGEFDTAALMKLKYLESFNELIKDLLLTPTSKRP